MALVQSFPHLLFLYLWVVSWPFTSLVTHTPSAMCKCARVQYSSICNCQSIPLQVLATHNVQCAKVTHTPSAMCKSKCALQHITGSQQSAISSSFYCKCAVQCIWCNFQSVTMYIVQCTMYNVQCTMYIVQCTFGWTALQCRVHLSTFGRIALAGIALK